MRLHTCDHDPTRMSRPYPIVNIVADGPSGHSKAMSVLTSSRKRDQEQALLEAGLLDDESSRAKHDLELDNALLERLSVLNALAKRLRG